MKHHAHVVKRGLPLVSVVITTKNEEKNIENCIKSVKDQTYPLEKIELIVVDNNSTDKTIDIAKKFTKNVYIKGPKRANQLNFGVNISNGDYIIYPDADMILSQKVIEQCVEKCRKDGLVALYIPERIIGEGFWIKVRDFERGFYNATIIDAVRFIRKDAFEKVGGFDEYIEFGADDWDFDRRVRKIGKTSIIKSALYHNEGKFELKRYLKKKSGYSKKLGKYMEKWGKNDIIIKKQLGANYRIFGVFIENGKWKRLLRYPFLAIPMYLLRLRIGFIWILEEIR